MEILSFTDGDRLSFPDDGDMIFSWRWRHYLFMAIENDYLFMTLETSVSDSRDISFPDDGDIICY
jgi:hypothetical protein